MLGLSRSHRFDRRPAPRRTLCPRLKGLEGRQLLSGGLYNPPPFAGHAGPLLFHNLSNSPERVTMYAPTTGKEQLSGIVPANSDCYIPKSTEGVLDDFGIQLNKGRILPVGQVSTYEKLPNGAMGFQTDDDSMNLGYRYTAPSNDHASTNFAQWVDNRDVYDSGSATVNLHTMVVTAAFGANNYYSFSSYQTTMTITIDNWSGQPIWSAWMPVTAPGRVLGVALSPLDSTSFTLPSTIAWEQVNPYSIHLSAS